MISKENKFIKLEEMRMQKRSSERILEFPESSGSAKNATLGNLWKTRDLRDTQDFQNVNGRKDFARRAKSYRMLLKSENFSNL